MKATGIVRKVGKLGRIVIPKELRELLGINIKDPLEFFTENKTIILRRYNPGCLFCETVKNLTRYKNNNICYNCLEELKKKKAKYKKKKRELF